MMKFSFFLESESSISQVDSSADLIVRDSINHDVLGVEMHPRSRSVQSVQESHTLSHINGKFESQSTVQHNVAPLMQILIQGSQWHELCDNNQIWWGGAAANDWHNIGIGEDPENI